MSEAITKACPYEHIIDHDEHCPFCHGTNRTVDIEATLRAEVARLTRRLSVVEEQLQDVSHKRQNAEELLSIVDARCVRFENEAVLLSARIKHAEKAIAEKWCRCECMHEPHEHGADCDPCPACRVYAALRGDA